MTVARRVRRIAVVLSTSLLVLTTGGPAYAQGRMLTSDPANGAALASAPQRVTLRFDAPVSVPDSHVSVRTTAGAEVAGEPAGQGDVLTVPVSIAGTGDYLVAYHVLYADGDEDFGVVQFSVGTGVPPSPAPAAVVEQARYDSVAHQHTVDPVGATFLFVDLLVLCSVLGLLYLKRPGVVGRIPGRANETHPTQGAHES
ncbi:MAG: copper resistance protein CopC [Hamadaea sp.]|uniref:copper resistance CopC family protein n=1 Tax=Hamadaea sp. TaxID=2024425 RepID=UPI0017A13870|nr:copper resistance CopC family protein [Hamadaea sp.]NUT24090.1 copper resistance protein CopC [Hamadaea sp.]